VSDEALFRYALGLADDQLVLAQRLSEWSGRAPTLEEDLALANIALDLLGQSRALYQLAAEIEGGERDEDALAFRRDERGFLNVQLVEQPNGDFGRTIARQVLYCAYMSVFWPALAASSDARLAGIAAKAAKESAYHIRHATEWAARLGDGTALSHDRIQAGFDELWSFTGELFEMRDDDRALGSAAADLTALKPEWDAIVDSALARATLARPEDSWMATGGRNGLHGEHLGHMLAEMQFLQRSYPGLKW
jgi:ring-1,2-phenylacetyl-CoA epoxidase subunit PaaC